MIWATINRYPRKTKPCTIIMNNEIPTNVDPLVPEVYSVVALSNRKFPDRIRGIMIKNYIIILRLV